MPYSLSPPGFSRASNTVTSWPYRARRCAAAMPAGPAPTTATCRPVAGARAKGVGSRSINQSVATR